MAAKMIVMTMKYLHTTTASCMQLYHSSNLKGVNSVELHHNIRNVERSIPHN